MFIKDIINIEPINILNSKPEIVNNNNEIISYIHTLKDSSSYSLTYNIDGVRCLIIIFNSIIYELISSTIKEVSTIPQLTLSSIEQQLISLNITTNQINKSLFIIECEKYESSYYA